MIYFAYGYTLLAALGGIALLVTMFDSIKEMF